MSTDKYVYVNDKVYKLNIDVKNPNSCLIIRNKLYEEIFLYFNSGNKLIDLPKDKCMHHYYAFATSNKILAEIDSYWFGASCPLCDEDEKNNRIAPAKSDIYIRYKSLTINHNIHDLIPMLTQTTANYNKMIYHEDNVDYLIPDQLINHLLTLCMKCANVTICA